MHMHISTQVDEGKQCGMRPSRDKNERTNRGVGGGPAIYMTPDLNYESEGAGKGTSAAVNGMGETKRCSTPRTDHLHRSFPLSDLDRSGKIAS